ncbi:MAG: thrombospondin type 3 repeat-containing protein, partial [Deltaproteobacteria bacterium]|nr:thrombospondin type 3 repeat-containing protein [Deltaproteobacteria bacterium]
DQIDLYFGYWSYNSDKLNLCEPNCIFGFRDASGVNHPVLDINDRLLGNDLIKACETRGAHNVPDTDHDSIPDPWDDCVYVINPDQTDTDRDGSGDACDCDNDNGVRDDCDNDDVPNRFDRSPLDPAVSLLQPMRQLPDMVYDPMPRTIAVRSDLRTAQSDVPASNVGEFFYSGPNTWLPAGSELIIRDQPIGSGVERNRCGMPPNTFPGPNPCDYMGRDENGSELTVVVPKVVVVNPGPEDTPSKPSPAENLQQFCISKVGREDPRTAALFEGERKMIIAANDRAASITGIKDYDLFVGGEGGLKHFECAFTGGALANVAKATGVQATTSSETTAPFGVWQLSGLPPMKYERRPTVAAVVPGSPLRLAPLDAPSVLSASISLAPNVSAFLPGVNQEVVLPSEGVQVGVRRYNLNGNMVIKALNESDDFTAEGTYFSVSDPQTLIVMDFKAYPAPASRKPVEHRQYNLETVFQELTKRVADLTAQGKPVTLDIYRNLPWESPMQPEFLVAQESLPGSADVSRAMGVGANTDEIGSIGSGSNQAIVPSYIIPPGFGMAGGGCGCRLNAPVSPLMAILTWLMLLAPLPILGYCRRKRNR